MACRSLILTGVGAAEPHARAASKGRSASGSKRAGVRPPSPHPGDQEEQVDGSKIFTGDTEVLDVGEWSVEVFTTYTLGTSLQFLVSEC